MAEVLGVCADRSAPGYPLIRLQALGAKAGTRCYPSREYWRHFPIPIGMPP